jgi:hypothetical protein
MSAETFEAVRQLVPTLSERRIQVARSVLVDASTYQAAADRFGGTRQDAHKATAAVWTAYERYQAAERTRQASDETTLPEGWQRVTLDAPIELIEQLRKKIAKYQENTLEPAGGRPKKTRSTEGEPG